MQISKLKSFLLSFFFITLISILLYKILLYPHNYPKGQFIKLISFFYGNSNFEMFSDFQANYLCTESSLYCRPLGYEFYKHLFVITNISAYTFTFINIFLYCSLCWILWRELRSLLRFSILQNIFFFYLFINFKTLKLVFTISDDSLSILLVISILILLIQNIKKFNLFSFYLLSILIGFSFIVRTANLFLIIIPFFFIKNVSKKIHFFFSLFLISIMPLLEHSIFYNINKFNRYGPFWADMQGKLVVISSDHSSQKNNVFEENFNDYKELIYKQNTIYRNYLQKLDLFASKQWYENSTISIFSNSKIAGPILEFENIFDKYKKININENEIIKKIFFENVSYNKINLIKATFYNYLGFWQVREINLAESNEELRLFLNQIDQPPNEHYKRVFKSTNHNFFLILLFKIFMFTLLIMCFFFFILGFNKFFKFIFYKNYTPKADDIIYILLFFCIILLNAYFFVTSFGSLVQIRLIFNVWPLICLIFFCSFILLSSVFFKK